MARQRTGQHPCVTARLILPQTRPLVQGHFIEFLNCTGQGTVRLGSMPSPQQCRGAGAGFGYATIPHLTTDLPSVCEGILQGKRIILNRTEPQRRVAGPMAPNRLTSGPAAHLDVILPAVV